MVSYRKKYAWQDKLLKTRLKMLGIIRDNIMSRLIFPLTAWLTNFLEAWLAHYSDQRNSCWCTCQCHALQHVCLQINNCPLILKGKLTLTIPDATECNSLTKVMDVVALCISVVAVVASWTELFCIAVNPCCIWHCSLGMNVVYLVACWVNTTIPSATEDPCWMLHSQHAQCNKITCCTLLHKACYILMTISKVDLYIQFYIQQQRSI